jgi:PAS domain S-box-containing protein
VAAILYVHQAAPRHWTAEEVAFVRGAAERAWAASARARAEAALREGKRRLRATQDHAGVGIHEVDREGRYARVSATFTRMTGYTAADLAGRCTWDLIEDEADRHEARAAFARLVRGEIDGTAEQRPYTNKHGRRWWAEVTTTAVRDEGGRFLSAVRVLHDITERKRAEERRALLVAELNHRVKNTLAVVQSLAVQTARGAPDLPAFSSAFQARLIALARAHDLLTREDWTGAPLDAVVRAALAPLAVGRARLDLSGCASGAVLPPGAALALAMALHELATNALKHGALSVPEGRVSVACTASDAADGGSSPVVEWTERGGPPVAAPPSAARLRLAAARARAGSGRRDGRGHPLRTGGRALHAAAAAAASRRSGEGGLRAPGLVRDTVPPSGVLGRRNAGLRRSGDRGAVAPTRSGAPARPNRDEEAVGIGVVPFDEAALDGSHGHRRPMWDRAERVRAAPVRDRGPLASPARPRMPQSAPGAPSRSNGG